MRIWRRKRRFKPFNRHAMPSNSRAQFDDMLAEGLLVSEAAVRMTLRNRFVVDSVRDGAEFTKSYAENTARAVLFEIAEEANESADHISNEEEIASGRSGASKHQHDYHAVDTKNLRQRAEVQRAIAAELHKHRLDDDYVVSLAERVREEAWDEISQALEQFAASEKRRETETAGGSLADDDPYSHERKGRMKVLLGDIKRESKRVKAVTASTASAGSGAADASTAGSPVS